MSRPDATRGGDGTGGAVLSVRDLVTRYPIRASITGAMRRRPERFVTAVDGVSLDLAAGRTLSLIGESGSGKTTLARSILGTVRPTSGSVRFGSAEIGRLSGRGLKPVRRHLQAVYQDPYESLDPRFTVARTVTEPLIIHGIGTRRERPDLVAAMLERCGLSPAGLFLQRRPEELSGGQRQRVAIAASLIIGPSLLVADEPVSMLDVSVRADILGLLDRMRRETGMAIFMITHDFATAARFSDRLAVMYAGRIVEEGDARSVVQRPHHPYTRALLSVIPHRDPARRGTPTLLPGDPPDAATTVPGCSFHPRCPLARPPCTESPPPLHEAAAEPGTGHLVACHYS